MIRFVRLFTAIFLPDSLATKVGSQTGRLNKGNVRWVAPSSLHLTLRFLGRVEEARLPVVLQVLEKMAPPTAPLELRLGRPGAFPNSRRSRVYWISVEGDTDRLAGLAGSIDSALTQAGFPGEGRRFIPHLTVGRAVSYCGPADFASFEKALTAVSGEPFGAAGFQLVESHLGPTGSRYKILKDFPFSQ